MQKKQQRKWERKNIGVIVKILEDWEKARKDFFFIYIKEKQWKREMLLVAYFLLHKDLRKPAYKKKSKKIKTE